MSRAEIHDAITNDLGLHVSDDELDTWLAVADADGSDVIDEEEWLILMVCVSFFIMPLTRGLSIAG